jgi:stalled ribosome rescue protein Dom34
MTNKHFHAVMWIDHREARVFHFGRDDVDTLVLHPDNPTHQVHHKSNTIGSGHEVLAAEFLHAAAHSIADAGSVLITGPGNAKTELMSHIEKHDPELLKIILGVETVDHPTDNQLVAYARKYFKSADQMQHPIS